jgi:hypothetical protein
MFDVRPIPVSSALLLFISVIFTFVLLSASVCRADWEREPLPFVSFPVTALSASLLHGRRRARIHPAD